MRPARIVSTSSQKWWTCIGGPAPGVTTFSTSSRSPAEPGTRRRNVSALRRRLRWNAGKCSVAWRCEERSLVHAERLCASRLVRLGRLTHSRPRYLGTRLGRVRRTGAGRPRHRPEAVVGDKGYSYRIVRQLLVRRRIRAVIPRRSDQRPFDGRHRFDPLLYRDRNRIERLVGRLKQHRRIATRLEKRAAHFLAMLILAAVRLWCEPPRMSEDRCSPAARDADCGANLGRFCVRSAPSDAVTLHAPLPTPRAT